MTGKKKTPKCLIYGNHLHHLDHLAPLSSLLDTTLVVTEKAVEEAAHFFYPNIDVTYVPVLQVPSFLLETTSTIISSLPRTYIESLFVVDSAPPSIWCPHGNSDKGSIVPQIKGLKNEKSTYLYGEGQRAFFENLGVLQKDVDVQFLGNYRYEYYLENQAFFDSKLTLDLNPKKKTLLYAPTWSDREKTTSLYSALKHITHLLTEEYNVIVKVHPNTLENNLLSYLKLLRECKQEGVFFLDHFPPIYPLLNITDIYIGDASSIGYDFLAFDRPMIFLKEQEKDLALHACGLLVSKGKYEMVAKVIKEDQAHLSSIRKEVYSGTFSSGGSTVTRSTLCKGPAVG